MAIRSNISKEILLILIIKILLLLLLWQLFFSHPPDKHSLPALTASHLFNIQMEKNL
jgi:hypothetical protein